MNTFTNDPNSEYADDDGEITEKESQTDAIAVATAYHPLTVQPLSGYESIMRKHAAACEAGR